LPVLTVGSPSDGELGQTLCKHQARKVANIRQTRDELGNDIDAD
jgi:hypothetical protein